MPLTTSQDQESQPPTMRFTSTQRLFRCIYDEVRVPGDVLTIDRVREARRRKFRLRRYDSASGILTIAVPTRLHETLHLQLRDMLLAQLVYGGIERDWVSMGAPTLHTTAEGPPYPGGKGGRGALVGLLEGDSTGGPWPARGGPDHWPTLVVLAGESESLEELRGHMEWWFAKSRHEVKIVLLAKFDHGRQVVVLERWEEEEPPARAGATTTRLNDSLWRPALRQEITIGRDGSTDPVSYHVTGGELVLGFRQLFLRGPGPGEPGEVVLSVEDLEKYAERVWSMVRDVDEAGGE
ncbi:hypothetical protein C8A01DRAFT_46060 [Parachaetomium inaequale]|uniref:Uncharacterized protein n=1 Tax=Parachaetomium inaequale TaxID=2588326 RepID=A0AAN6SSN2_9PEZI|nr:hypothetical protein C8A01DRAFT_46060 [Parachaetomium inaequale]